MADNTITGRAKKYDGTAIDYVSIFNWDDGKCIAQVVPDISGNWQYNYTEDLQVGLTYVADGCEPITHGSYYFEFLGNEYADNVVALLHFDGDLTDEVGNVFASYGTINFNSGVFGQCATFSGDSYISASNGNTFDFLLGDFTVEQFVKFAALPTGAIYSIVGNYRNNDGWVFQLRDDGSLGMRLRFASGDMNVVDRAWTPSLGVWYHLAVTRHSGLVYIFVDGVLLGGSAVLTANVQAASGNALNIGALRYNSSIIQHFNGSIDEVRITKGVARYTENFTPPTEPFSF